MEGVSSKLWLYQSLVNQAADDNAGLVGPMIITERGKALPDGRPDDVDTEFMTVFKACLTFRHHIAPTILHSRAGRYGCSRWCQLGVPCRGPALCRSVVALIVDRPRHHGQDAVLSPHERRHHSNATPVRVDGFVGAANTDGGVLIDHAQTFDESSSHYFARNNATFGPGPTFGFQPALIAFTAFKATINGLQYCTLKGLTAEAGSRVRWHVGGQVCCPCLLRYLCCYKRTLLHTSYHAGIRKALCCS